MVKIRFDPIVCGPINPTELQRARAVLNRKLEELDPKDLRAKRSWLETVEVFQGAACARFFASCVIKYEGTGWYVDITMVRKQTGERRNPLARP